MICVKGVLQIKHSKQCCKCNQEVHNGLEIIE